MNHPKKYYCKDGPVRPANQIVYEDMDKFLILKAALLTQVGSGPSGLDADGWRKILTSRSFWTASSDLCKTFALFVKKTLLRRDKKCRIPGVIHCMQVDPIR